MENSTVTPPRSFRMDDEIIGKLDELVERFAREWGRPENRTTVLYQLISREHAKNPKKKRSRS